MLMIKHYGKKLTPKEAARLIIDEGIENGCNHWEEDSSTGFYIGQEATPEEMSRISEQIAILIKRIERNVLKVCDLNDKLAQREDIE